MYKNKVSVSVKDLKLMSRSMGGFWKFVRLFMSLMIGMTRYTLSSKKNRSRFRQLSKGKRILIRNRSTSKYVGYVLGVGRKV